MYADRFLIGLIVVFLLALAVGLLVALISTAGVWTPVVLVGIVAAVGIVYGIGWLLEKTGFEL